MTYTKDGHEFSLTLGDHLQELQECISKWAQNHKQLFDEKCMWQAEAQEARARPYPLFFQPHPGTCQHQQEPDQSQVELAVNGHHDNALLMSLPPQQEVNKRSPWSSASQPRQSRKSELSEVREQESDDDSDFSLCNELPHASYEEQARLVGLDLEDILFRRDSKLSSEIGRDSKLSTETKRSLEDPSQLMQPLDANWSMRNTGCSAAGSATDSKNVKFDQEYTSGNEGPWESGGSPPPGTVRHDDVNQDRTSAVMSEYSEKGTRPSSIERPLMLRALIDTLHGNKSPSHSTQQMISFQSKETKKVVEHKAFEMLSAIVIGVNACVLGFAADYGIKNLENPKSSALEIIEICFVIFYTVEIVLRISKDGREYFVGEDIWWNLFDMGLVLLGILDQVMKMMNVENAMQNVSFLRTLRLTKALKLFRIVRLMVMFKDLRLILYSLAGCMKAMVWMCGFISMILYMFAVFFLQGCIGFLTEDPGNTSSITAEQINTYWGSMGTAMRSMFMSTTAGVDWYIVVEPLKKVGFLHHCMFYVYIGFFTFVVLNTLTSVFVEASLQNADKDYQMIIDNELQKKDVYVAKLRAWFDEIDTEGIGEISYESFCSKINDPRMHAFAASLEMDLFNAKQFFYMISNQGSSTVDLATFVVGCIKLKGTSKALDLQALMHAHKKFVKEQHEVAMEIRNRLSKIETKLYEDEASISP